MEVHIVGTGDAYALEGTNSSILVAQNGYRLSVDCGPTVPQTLWKSCHPWMEIDGIYFTHLHPDHATAIPRAAPVDRPERTGLSKQSKHCLLTT